MLADLYQHLAGIGCPPYYFFQGRPATGNEPYEVPIVRGWEVFHEVLRRGSGPAHRLRFVMSHETGKIEVLAVDDHHIYLRHHRAKDEADRGRFVIYKRNDQAYWLEQLEPENDEARRFEPSSAYALWDGPD